MAVKSYNNCSVKHGIQYALQRSKGANCVDLSLSWQGWDSRGVDFFNWSRHFFWPFCLNIDFFIFSNCCKGHYLLTKNPIYHNDSHIYENDGHIYDIDCHLYENDCHISDKQCHIYNNYCHIYNNDWCWLPDLSKLKLMWNWVNWCSCSILVPYEPRALYLYIGFVYIGQ